MTNRSDWLDRCFDQSDQRAPSRAFAFGAISMSVLMVFISVVVDPTDLQLFVLLLSVGVFLGGGCAAMFALPHHQFRRIWKLSFHIWPIVVPFNIFFVRGSVVLIAILTFTGLFTIALALTTLNILLQMLTGWITGLTNPSN